MEVPRASSVGQAEILSVRFRRNEHDMRTLLEWVAVGEGLRLDEGAGDKCRSCSEEGGAHYDLDVRLFDDDCLRWL